MRTGRGTAFGLLAVGIAATASGAVRHVPGEYGTIGAAIAAATPGDVVEVAEGTYAPSTNGETFPLLVTKDDLVLSGAGMGLTVLDAEGTSRVITWDASSGGRVTGLTIRGGLSVTGGGARIQNGNPEFDHILFADNGADLRGAAIYLVRQALPTSAPWIHHNVMWNNLDTTPLDAVDTHGVVAAGEVGGVFEHNLVARTDGNGLLTSTNALPLVRHNLFVENGIPGPPARGRGICWLADTAPLVQHNLFFANQIAAILWPGGGGNVSAAVANSFDPADGVFGNVDGDPLLADPDGGDFHLTAGSPAIDAGDPTRPLDPDGTIADLGPFWFDQSGTVDAPAVAGVAPALRATPNPFRAATTLRFTRQAGRSVAARVVDVTGRTVRTLATSPSGSAESDSVEWDGRDAAGHPVAAGVYLVIVDDGVRRQSLPVVRLR